MLILRWLWMRSIRHSARWDHDVWTEEKLMIAQLNTACSHPRPEKRLRDPSVDARSSSENDWSLEVMAKLSHELRNSLGSLRNAMHVLRIGPMKSPVQEKAQVLAERQITQMTRLVDDLLDTSRMHNGGLQLRRGRFDLCVIVGRAMHSVECTMREREHHLAVSFPDEPLWVQGDADRLEQVFVNLLVNAAKYTDVGGHVRLSVKQEASQAIVRIRDSGVGIAADVLPTVFDLYVQANPSSRDGGLGLGLSLVRSLVDGHGGSVTAASDGVGKGSEFTVRLPVFAAP
jgi:signal transduction histidine kinase